MRRILPAILLLTMAAKPACAQALSSSNLPIIVINSRPGPTPVDSAWFDIKADMGVIDNGPGRRNSISDPYNNFAGPIEIKVQGSSSVAWPKKSYRITTLNSLEQKTDVPLLGLPSHEDWILKASYQDKTFLRDELAFRIHTQMGHYSSRVRYFELVMDGQYRGLYQLEEKVRRGRDRVDISKMSKEDNFGDDLTGGYIISLDKYTAIDPGWYSKYKSNATKDSANFFLYYYPRPDSITAAQQLYIKEYVDRFEDVLAGPTYADPVTGYRKYIDVRSFIDNFIVNEVSKNVDGYRASTYFYKDKESSGNGKLQASPLWDFNIAFGNCDYNGGNLPYGWQYQQYATINYVPWWWERLMSDPDFRNDLKCRYTQLRKSVLADPGIDQWLDQMAGHLNEAQGRNFTRWPIMGQVVWPGPAPAPADYAAEIGYLKYFVHERLRWMDANLPGTCIPGISDSATEKDGLSAYPNPFKNAINVRYEITSKSKVTLEIINLMGQSLVKVEKPESKTGTYEETLHAAQLPEGTYIIRLVVNENPSYLKVVRINQ